MEFWSTEVKSGETFKVKPGRDMILHLSQASFGEIKKEKSKGSVYLFVNVDGQKLVLGTLSFEKLPQLQFDLVFDRDFELSHSWKGGSVYFFGYRMSNLEEECGSEADSDESDYSAEDEDMPLSLENIGKPVIKVKEEKSADTKKVEKAGVETANGLPTSEDDDSSDDDDAVSDDDDTDVDEDEDDEDDSEDEEGSEEDEDESEEDEPAKAEPGKKRGSDTEPETPAAKKKAKLTTPEKTDGKKGSGVHVDTPHPSKKAGKTSATENQKTAKSSGGGLHTCKSCSRTFGSGSGLDSHTKAKHGAEK